MYQKAKLFNDNTSAAKILKVSNPVTAKTLGKDIAGFDKATWASHSSKIVKKALYAKFTQNPALKNSLAETAKRVLVEASAHDTHWGVGLRLSDPLLEDPKMWKGKNILGKLLVEIRDELVGS